MKNNLGLIFALAAYAWWGVIPIFWKQLSHVDSIEIVMHRMVWSCVLVTLLIVVSRQWREFRLLFLQPKLLFKLFVASALVSINWAVFIWAVNTEHLVETSLGYFMNPLISVALAVVLFGEALRRGQVIALCTAALGVIYLVVSHGSLPWISLVLAISFSLYSAAKKSISVPATHGMAIETMFFFIPASIYLGFIEVQGNGHFFETQINSGLLVLGGLFTLVPLLLFAAAAKRISMTALGMTQYIGPTLQLMIGVFLYGESFGSQTMVAFCFIWLALGIYSFDQLRHQNKLRRSRR
jgi:chloramphenicol-sensitive protein RarD